MEWIKIFDSLSEGIKKVPLNDSMLINLKGEEICLFVTASGFWAIENKCPHQGLPLYGSTCENDVLTCTFHFLPLNIRTGACLKEGYKTAKTFPVQIREDGIYIEI